MSFRYIEHTADMEIIAEGDSMEDLFVESARAMYGIILNLLKVEKKDTHLIELEAKNKEYLIHDFLDELLFLLETKGMVFSGFDMKIHGNKLKCYCEGEKFDSEKHEEGSLVKAVTYNKLKVWEMDGSFKANIVFDM